MKSKIKLIGSFLMVSALVIFVQSCGEEPTTKNDNTNSEFIADSNTFVNFKTWTVGATKYGVDPSLGDAHNGNDSTAIRTVYFKDNVSPVNGKYPIGSIVVKHTTNTGGTLNFYTAMVKRGNGFNPSKGDWEFFVLDADGKISKDMGVEIRGADIMGGVCGGCHAGASSKDYIYSK